MGSGNPADSVSLMRPFWAAAGDVAIHHHRSLTPGSSAEGHQERKTDATAGVAAAYLETCLDRKRHEAVRPIGKNYGEARRRAASCAKEPTTRIRDGFERPLCSNDSIGSPYAVRDHGQFGAVSAADFLGLRVAARARHKP